MNSTGRVSLDDFKNSEKRGHMKLTLRQMKWVATESAKRTTGNSPALRVLGSASKMAKPVKRATENKGFGSAIVLGSVVRFADLRG